MKDESRSACHVTAARLWSRSHYAVAVVLGADSLLPAKQHSLNTSTRIASARPGGLSGRLCHISLRPRFAAIVVLKSHLAGYLERFVSTASVRTILRESMGMVTAISVERRWMMSSPTDGC